MNIIQQTPPAGQLTAQQQAEQVALLCDAWADAEAAYEAFLGQYEQIDVLMMSAPDFMAWRGNYSRLHNDLWIAQITYYQALRGSHG